MRRGGKRHRLSTFQAGLVAIVVIVIGVYLGFTKDIPFTKPFQMSAVFENAPPVQRGMAVRIAGVDVGKVSKVEALGDGSSGVKVTMKLEDAALPIHEDATVKARERIFLEGNLFMDIKPGSPSADAIGDGDTIPASQTSAPVQFDQVLGALQTNTRKDLQDLVAGFGDSLNGQPKPGEDDDQDPDVKGETGAQALNDSLDYAPDALRGGAIVNEATLGTERHDLSKLIAGQQKIFRALASREVQLKDLITNFNTTVAALASQEGNLRQTVHELPEVLEAAQPALDNLNAAFPSTRAWALEMIPGVEETPATIDAAFPWLAQARALMSPDELQGLVNDLQPAVADFAEFIDGQVELFPVVDAFNRCQYNTVLPSGEQVIQDGPLTTGIQNYKEFFQSLSGLVGAGQNFTGNGYYTRFQPGGGAYPVKTGLGRDETGANDTGVRYGSATVAGGGTRPAKGPKPPYKPKAACYKQPVPNLNSAPTGAAWAGSG
jgi:phospholipid/cholesterol/gamma-HCH transport system substrate-binding protein